MRGNLGKTRLADEHGAERDALRSQPRKLVDARKRPNAATDIDGYAFHLADGADCLGVRRACRLVLFEGGGKIDHVDPRRARVGERARLSSRVFGIYLHVSTVAVLKAHDPTCYKVDSGKENHALPSLR